MDLPTRHTPEEVKSVPLAYRNGSETLIWVALLCFLAMHFSLASQLQAAGEEEEIPLELLEPFENEIRPLLVQRCYSCHSASAKPAGWGNCQQ